MEWNKNRMFKVEPNEVQLFFHIKNNITEYFPPIP